MSGLYIRKFIDRVQFHEQRGNKDFVCSLADAKNLHNDITKLLLDLENLKANSQQTEQTIQIEMQGGSF